VAARQDDPLSIGGLLYLRAAATWNRGVAPADWPLSAPNLVDTFLDVRPHDRVRGFVLGRLFYDPTLPPQATDLLGRTTPQSQTRGALDQAYVNFDVDRTVFVTAGKQHVKWGVGRFWNPTDFLHPVRRDPLAQFDDRTGLAMVKAHLPWEARGWNLYGLAILEDITGVNQGPGSVGQVGGAARAEVVLGGAELAADLVAQRGHKPRFGLDGSAAIWDLDLRGELALTSGRDAPHWALTEGADPTQAASWRLVELDRITPQLVLGVEWSHKYSDQDALVAGLEYFFNDAGYDSARVYPVLLASLARHAGRLHPLLPGAPLRRGLPEPPVAGAVERHHPHRVGHRQPLRRHPGGAARPRGAHQHLPDAGDLRGRPRRARGRGVPLRRDHPAPAGRRGDHRAVPDPDPGARRRGGAPAAALTGAAPGPTPGVASGAG
jgi:hypothetical protein